MCHLMISRPFKKDYIGTRNKEIPLKDIVWHSYKNYTPHIHTDLVPTTNKELITTNIRINYAQAGADVKSNIFDQAISYEIRAPH